jgi:hypothetical protein
MPARIARQWRLLGEGKRISRRCTVVLLLPEPVVQSLGFVLVVFLKSGFLKNRFLKNRIFWSRTVQDLS